jgi:hypothetical protein
MHFGIRTTVSLLDQALNHGVLGGRGSKVFNRGLMAKADCELSNSPRRTSSSSNGFKPRLGLSSAADVTHASVVVAIWNNPARCLLESGRRKIPVLRL